MEMMPPPLDSVPPDALPALCRQFHVQRLDLFGSAADGRFDPARSDLDFLVTFNEGRDFSYSDAYFGLRESLSNLFGREIDLVTEAGLRNPYFRQSVEAQRRQVFPQS